MSTTKKAWINAIFFAATLGMNSLGGSGFFNGLSQGDVSNRYTTLITPSPATFGIWGLIYSLLIISIIAMIVKKDDGYFTKAINEITPLFILSNLLNMAWIIFFSYVLLELSALVILAFVIVLVLILLKLLKINDGKSWLLPASFGLYAGWLFIATVLNIALSLVKLEWNGFGIATDTWAIIMLIVAILLLTLVQTKIRNVIFPLPVAWGFFGIYQNLKAPESFNGNYALLQNVALVGAGVLVLVALVTLIKNGWWLLPNPQKS